MQRKIRAENDLVESEMMMSQLLFVSELNERIKVEEYDQIQSMLETRTNIMVDILRRHCTLPDCKQRLDVIAGDD